MLIYILVLCLVTEASLAETCPPLEDIVPCRCFGTLESVHAYCEGVSSLQQLEKAVQGFGRTKLVSFSINKSNFEYLPHDIFQNLTLQIIGITKSNLSRIGNIGEPQFKGQESSLHSLSIIEVFNQKHPFAYVSLDHLRVLRRLEVRNNHVEVLHNEWFRNGPTSLEEVRFVQGHIRRIGFRALQTMTRIRIVDLSDNKIDFIPRTVFPDQATLLEEINLERNALQSLSEDFFKGMPNLKRVNLELNELSTVDQSLWGSVWSQISWVNIDYNPLICDCKIRWIYEMDVDLEGKLVAMCFKPWKWSERELYTLKKEELSQDC